MKEEIKMADTKTGGFISKIQFNNGSSVDISKNDIVIFVGPNNAGKSQALKDIYNLSEKKCPATVITEITTGKYSGNLSCLLDSIATGQNQGNYIRYTVLNGSVIIHNSNESGFLQDPFFGDFRTLFVANMDTTARLSICCPPENITRDAPKQHPIHYAAFDSTYRKWLSESFKKAFGTEVIPNTQFGSSVPLCMGEPVKFNEDFEDEQTRQEAYAKVLEGYKQVQNQGDGIKSFTGILLYLMLNYYCTYLIDEPESFLHPPQARIMGQIIGETLSDQQQAFISTHSEDIIKGLLETCPKRLKIIRITREGDANYFSVLDNNKFSEVWNDPLLRHSNIMSSLFHKTVVLCESDADCQMYSIIESHIKQKQKKYAETLFVHCGGKQRMARIISALRALNVNVKTIPDLDVLNDKVAFKGLLEAYGIDWMCVQSDYNIIVSQIHNCPRETINRLAARTAIIDLLDRSSDANLTIAEIKEIQETLKTVSKWENIKKMGVSAIPAGDATAAFGRLNTTLKSAGIYLVPVGELECFVKEIGGHGPSWVNNTLEKFPDLDNDIYSKISEFVAELNL